MAVEMETEVEAGVFLLDKGMLCSNKS